ncbi:MAG: lysophospholipid acyltransferase family protein [Burkholderiaceae bacterium]|jgi:KDO2-lipid IV(A) lauroyltransferase
MTEAITWLGLWLCRLLAFGPRWLLRAIAALVGGLAFRFAARRRAIAMTNLALCFPDWPQEERIRIARQHFYFYARAFLERFEIWFGSPKRLRQRVLIEGMENFLAHQDKPIIILAPHFLGLDAGGVRFQLERQFASMYSHQSNPVLDTWTTQGRTRFNSPVILSRNQSITKIVGHLRRGLPIYFLPDMDFGVRDAVFAPFFGQPAATVTSVVRLSRLLGAAVVPLVTRITDQGYVARFYPGWQHPNDDAKETLIEGVTKMNTFIEQRILESPGQYLWTHRRFKSRPPGMPAVYG